MLNRKKVLMVSVAACLAVSTLPALAEGSVNAASDAVAESAIVMVHNRQDGNRFQGQQPGNQNGNQFQGQQPGNQGGKQQPGGRHPGGRMPMNGNAQQRPADAAQQP